MVNSLTFLRMMVLVALVVMVTAAKTPPRIVKAAPAVGAQEDAKLLQPRAVGKVEMIRNDDGYFYIIKENSRKFRVVYDYKYGTTSGKLDERLQNLQSSSPYQFDLVLSFEVQDVTTAKKCFADVLRREQILVRGDGGKLWFKAYDDTQVMKLIPLCAHFQDISPEKNPATKIVPKNPLKDIPNKPGYIYILGTRDPMNSDCKAMVGVQVTDPIQLPNDAVALQCGNRNKLHLLQSLPVEKQYDAKKAVLDYLSKCRLQDTITGSRNWFECTEFMYAKQVIQLARML